MKKTKMKTKTKTKTKGKTKSRNDDDRQGARDFALSIGIEQMSRVRSVWVRQDVRAELGRQDLESQPQLLLEKGVIFFSFLFLYYERLRRGLGWVASYNILVGGERFPKNRINGV